MNISTVRKSVAIWIVVVFSKTLFVFHGVLLAAIVLVAFFSF